MAKSPPIRFAAVVSLALILGRVHTTDAAAPPTAASKAASVAPLQRYVAKPDTSYKWQVRRQGKLGTSQYAEIVMTSQTWKGVRWQHQLVIINPASADKNNRNAMLLISGGRWKTELEQQPSGKPLPTEAYLLASLAEQIRSPLAILQHVPFQPMFDGKVEDQIIALTFEKFMESGDSEWPLLLPMVKSAVRGMDTVQEFVADTWKQKIESFTVTGASKRGWTTWLTGAVDSRAKAIAPMVIDMLNMAKQMKHQSDVWGKLSYKVDDYSELNLPERLSTPRGKALAKLVDPYSYRASLKQPKLIILGTNDHYWPLDALNLYWSDLVGEKRILYIPNNRHGLKDFARLTGSLAAMHHHLQSGESLPDLKWKFEKQKDGVQLSIRCDHQPQRMQVWMANAENRDFRPSVWSAKPMKKVGDHFIYTLKTPTTGHLAMFGEAVFSGKASPFFLSTTVTIIGSNTIIGSK